MRHRRAQRERGPQTEVGTDAGRRRDAVDRDPHPHHVEARVRERRSRRPSWRRGRGADPRRPPRGRPARRGTARAARRCTGRRARRPPRSACRRRRAAARDGRSPAAPAPPRRPGARPTRCIPVSTFRCTVERVGALVGDGLGQRVDAGLGVDDGRQPARDDLAGRLGPRLGQHEDRRVDARRHAARRPPRPARRRGRRHRRRPRRARPGPRRARRRRPSPPPSPRPGATSARSAPTLCRIASRSISTRVGRYELTCSAARWRTRSPRATIPTGATALDDHHVRDVGLVHQRGGVLDASPREPAAGTRAPSPRRPWTRPPCGAPRRSARPRPAA